MQAECFSLEVLRAPEWCTAPGARAFSAGNEPGGCLWHGVTACGGVAACGMGRLPVAWGDCLWHGKTACGGGDRFCGRAVCRWRTFMQDAKEEKTISEKGQISVKLPGRGVIRGQEISLSDDVTIVYGCNNCGKTTLLKQINDVLDRRAMDNFLEGTGCVISNYIPTNRVVVNTVSTEARKLRDIEEFIHYKQDIYSDYSLHLKNIRDSLFGIEFVRDFVIDAVNRMFGTDVGDFEHTYSDGMENIINIYACMIWSLVWDKDLSGLDENKFRKLISGGHALILVDEIEMFLHVSIQSRLIGGMKSDFPGCRFLFTTHSPLLLTRYKNAEIFQIEDGLLKPVEDDLYYKDLDIIYEGYFRVWELPEEIIEDINYLGEVVFGTKSADAARVGRIIENIGRRYPNIYKKYNKLIIKAEDMAGI